MRLTQLDSCTFKALKLMLLTLLIGLTTSLAFGATTGSISGTARDEQGAVIPNAKVVLLNTSTGVVQTLTTDSAGFYNFPSLLIGHYDITFESAGFEKYTEKGIIIDVDMARRVDATMKPGSVAEQVTVTVESAQLAVETENAQMGQVIGSAEIENVPLDGRDYTDLLALQPGVVPINVQWYNSVTPPNGGNDGVLSISGAQDVHSGYYVDGASTVDGAGSGTFLMPVLDSIAEFRIVTNNAGAEYGGYSGGITNVVTKSGTNRFHGNAFEYLRNANLNAAGYFNTGASQLHQNIFGGTLGGPIVPNKLFFFGDYQGLRNSDGQGINGNVLSDAERSGDLNEEAAKWAGNSRKVGSTGMADVLTQRLGYPVSVGEWYYSNTAAGFTCHDNSQCVFPDGKIPQTAWDPLSANIMNTYLPHANSTQSGLPYYVNNSTKTTWTENKGAARVDTTTRFGQVAGYWHYDPWKNTEPGSWGPTVPGFPSSQVGAAQMVVASLTTPFGSSAVNTFVASWTYNRNIQGPLSTGDPKSLTELGWPSADQGGPAQISVGPWQMMPQITWKGLGPTGFGGAVTTQYNNIYQGQDDFSKVYKTHSLKFGAQYHWDHVNIGKPQNASNGIFKIGSNETGLNDADYMLGAVSSMQQGQPAFVNMRNFYVGIYGEDSWRATRDLTLNYGVRWEVNPWWREAHNHVPVIVPGRQSTRFPTAPPDYVFPGEPGIPEHLANINWYDFGPRFGAAYTPDFGENPILRKIFGEHGQSSIRAGFGLYFTNIEGYNTWNLSAAPYGLFYNTPWSSLLSTPYIDRRTGVQQPNPFPVDINNYNWALQLPFNKLRSPRLHEASPYSEHVDFSVQRQVTSKTLVQLAYVGTFGHHLDVVADGNAGDPALCLYLSDPNNVTDGNTCYPYGGEDSKNVYHAVNGQTYHGTREALGPNFRSMGWQLDVGNSNYHAFQAMVRHTSGRASLLLGYTWSKAIDNGSGRGDQIFEDNPKWFRGLSLYDVPQNFVVTYAYELPFDKFIHASDRLTRGWRISGSTRASDGVPVWIMEGDDQNLRGDFMSAWGGVTTDEPMLATGNIKGDHNPRHQLPWFNTSLFSQEPLGGQGNSPRRFFHGPGINNTDLAIMKDVRLTEGMTLQLRAEAFNAWNHAQFYGAQVMDSDFADGLPNFVNGQNTGGTFGLIGGANDMRKAQLVAKVSF
jgi:hypothetical protein